MSIRTAFGLLLIIIGTAIILGSLTTYDLGAGFLVGAGFGLMIAGFVVQSHSRRGGTP